MVRLLRVIRELVVKIKKSFNPTMVRLLRGNDTIIIEVEGGFNPTMVRLLHISVNWTPPDARTVSIPQWCDCCQPSSCNKPVRRRFQSHNGAIAAHRRGEGYAKALNGFNPTMVRLLHNLDRALMENLPVSIPQWCDCCLRYLLGGECDAKGFNPTMVRLLPMSSQQTQRFSSSFNPTMVRLLLSVTKSARRRGSSFNPTMVRLLRSPTTTCSIDFAKFQSHNGAIAACVGGGFRCWLGGFQSHNGAIAAVHAFLVQVP